MIRPIITDDKGVVRFQANPLLVALMNRCVGTGFSLNDLMRLNVTDADRSQFAQMIGYSVSAWGGLSYVTESERRAVQAVIDEGQDASSARLAALENQLHELKDALREPIARLFGVHPDALEP